jgi:hypothetical protein
MPAANDATKARAIVSHLSAFVAATMRRASANAPQRTGAARGKVAMRTPDQLD